ncbi:hypothetical protein ANCDUO_27542 [Ancylostoma duodenale]|uniref:Carrier protein PET8 domain protein n=1 Tax=Ancylostoma duodenale TaxID=51022 RepID=A0A0C2BFG1_9BILA|nr:hypothetical protein ANCDUO_27542 [Ancylostoma duodenale]
MPYILAAIYWAVYQYLKRNILAWRNMEETTFATAFACGATAGSFAAIITTPFDVMKTHLQIQLGDENAARKVPTKQVIKQIMERGGGVTALFAVSKLVQISGVVPRVAKIAPACAVMIGSYEYFKVYFARRNKRYSQLRFSSDPDL